MLVHWWSAAVNGVIPGRHSEYRFIRFGDAMLRILPEARGAGSAGK